ncbi:hypothetical protein [Streptomyces sp. NPDC096132]|uniref:hypothetical protein n=1 Tax=Streptomyces sp. NPDC096132 TaxID=3366075 RepID=UPI00381AE7EA
MNAGRSRERWQHTSNGPPSPRRTAREGPGGCKEKTAAVIFGKKAMPPLDTYEERVAFVHEVVTDWLGRITS